MGKPSVNKVKWLSIYSKNGLEVYSNPDDLYADFRIKLNNHWAKRFYGETAWMDVTRFVHEQAMEFWDFAIDDIYANRYVEAMTELSNRLERL